MRIPGGHRQERPRLGPLGWGFSPLKLDEDNPAIMDVATLATGEDSGTCKILSK
jgi:hypothetical protein